MTPYTSGPWSVIPVTRNKRARLVDLVVFGPGLKGGYPVAKVGAHHHGDRAANARLISAAPDLADACSALCRAGSDGLNVGAARNALALARAALEKAGLL